MSTPNQPPSKLFIRSEVLAVIEYLSVVVAPSKQDKAKQVKRLSAIEPRDAVLEILLKEMSRTSSPQGLEVISELLMELGSIESLKDPLWQLIRLSGTSDEVKDAANLVLRQLGDNSDPDLYLDYLADPQGLISRETERMLEVAARNPEALIDFIDFIFSLPVPEQLNLVDSLHSDYGAEHLVNLYIPMFLANPPEILRELILQKLVDVRSPQVAQFVYQLNLTIAESADPYLLKALKKATSELRLAGVYREELLKDPQLKDGTPLSERHPILEETSLSQCYATLMDGIGNQGLMICREHENGDKVLLSVAINDMHGIVDCFGFYQLSPEDFQRIVDKFHEEACRIEVDPAYCLARLTDAEVLSRKMGIRIPYEYTCWQVALGDFPVWERSLMTLCQSIARPEWADQCRKLYYHPDFETWFLEEDDHPIVAEILEQVREKLLAQADGANGMAYQVDMDALVETLDRLGQGLVLALMTTEWKELFIDRLSHVAYLLNQEGTKTFACLCATEAMKLTAYDPADEASILRVGFTRQFGRRCIEEYLLRLKSDLVFATKYEPFLAAVFQAATTAWESTPPPLVEDPTEDV